MTEHVIVGPCLTRREAARRAGITPAEARRRPDLIHLRGRWLEETYLAFQFDGRGVEPDLGQVVMKLRENRSGLEIADWLVRPNPLLDNATPLAWLKTGHTSQRVLEAASQR